MGFDFLSQNKICLLYDPPRLVTYNPEWDKSPTMNAVMMAKAAEMLKVRAFVSTVDKQRPEKISDSDWDKLCKQIADHADTDLAKMHAQYPYVFAEKTGDANRQDMNDYVLQCFGSKGRFSPSVRAP